MVCRYRDQGPGRCLKLHLTDGVQDITAMEYRFISALAVLMPAGLKLLIVNPEVRRGMLLLQAENVVVLGGVVSDAVYLSIGGSMSCRQKASETPGDGCKRPSYHNTDTTLLREAVQLIGRMDGAVNALKNSSQSNHISSIEPVCNSRQLHHNTWVWIRPDTSRTQSSVVPECHQQ
eukprot:GHUV01039037.1.p1 GENE.GHUV01039037.1~~GHUV01039037.1.p1  ORF type:complete len:176 (+),score=38.60 GHUV01039037.1:567-1094(+)